MPPFPSYFIKIKLNLFRYFKYVSLREVRPWRTSKQSVGCFFHVALSRSCRNVNPAIDGFAKTFAIESINRLILLRLNYQCRNIQIMTDCRRCLAEKHIAEKFMAVRSHD